MTFPATVPTRTPVTRTATVAASRRVCCAAILASLLLLPVIAAAEPLQIEDGWVRALPPTQRMTAAYMTLHNAGDEALEVLSVSSDAAGHASLHATRRDGDRVRMEAVESLALQPGERVELAPGGLHVMLMGMERMPAAGETFGLCLQTSAGEQCTELPVLREPPSSTPAGERQ